MGEQYFLPVSVVLPASGWETLEMIFLMVYGDYLLHLEMANEEYTISSVGIVKG